MKPFEGGVPRVKRRCALKGSHHLKQTVVFFSYREPTKNSGFSKRSWPREGLCEHEHTPPELEFTCSFKFP